MMQDFLCPSLSDASLTAVSALALAHIGDGVYELMTRSALICSGILTARVLHRRTTACVCAAAQYRASQAILPLLTEEEMTIFRHGRNAKPKFVPKSSSSAEYAYATAIEALFGWLYLKQRYDRLNELYAIIVKAREQETEAPE